MSSYNDESKSIRNYGYGTPATHNPEDWTHLVWTPRWCYPCNGLNIEPKCRELHPYSFTLEESPQPVGANFANMTSTVTSTYVDKDTWSVLSELESIEGDDPTQIVKCLECKGRVPYADMIREICHSKCQDCERRFSHVTEDAQEQCEIIGELLARSERSILFQCDKTTCKRYDEIGIVDRGLCHGQCKICRSWTYRSEWEHRKYCYPPVSGIRDPRNPRPYMEIVEPIPNLRFPREMTDREELACQSIRYPSLPRNPTVEETINIHRVRHRNKCIEEARKKTSYCDWSVEAHNKDTLRLRPSGGLSVFRMKADRPSTSSNETDPQIPISSNLRSVNMSSSQAMSLDANITETLENRVITATWLDNSTDYILTNQRQKFKEELDEQQAIVQSLDNNTTNMSSSNIMDDSLNSSEDDFMNEINEQRATTTLSSTTSTIRASSSDMSSTTRASSTYTPLSHLSSQTIMETRQESLFNQRKRVRLANTVAVPFNPITTLNVHLPNDVDPFNNRPLSQEQLVEFDQFSRGLVCEAKRRMPNGCIVGNFSNEEMVEERRRQYKLYEDARANVLQDRINKATFPYPSNSPIHTPLNFIESSGNDMENSSDEEASDDNELPPANLSPLERVENLYQSDCSNERRKRKLRKDNTGEAVAPEKNEPESEDNNDDESTERDHEES